MTIAGKPLALQDQSHYKSSPLGDEAATRNFGANVMSHQITGKTYFVAWSMDVKAEGKNVCRHLDLTVSNCGSAPPGTPPNPNADAMAFAEVEDFLNQCACCGATPKHSAGAKMDFNTFYGLNETGSDGKPTTKALQRQATLERVKNKEQHGCTCRGKVLPEPPCNVFRQPVTQAEKAAIASAHRGNARHFRRSKGMPQTAGDAAALLGVPLQPDAEMVVKINHLTPKNGGGCPTGDKNLQMHFDLCSVCQGFDDMFGSWQSERPTIP